MEENDALAALTALAHPWRLRVYRLLVGAGPDGLTPGELSAQLGLPASTLSFHLRGLLDGALVVQDRQGRQLYYRPLLPRMQALLDYLSAHCCAGAGCAEPDAGVRGGPAGPATPPCGVPDCAPGNDPDPDRPEGGPMHVLILCTHNSARSVLAEAMLNHWAQRLGRPVTAHSAGSAASGRINPHALAVLQATGIDTAGLASKSWDRFAAADAPPLALVITVCDSAAAEVCPYFPGQGGEPPLRVHWGYPDPSRAPGEDADRARAFELTRQALGYRMLQLLALPLERMDRAALAAAVGAIAGS